jgi:5'-3' exonuclease
MSVPEAHPPLLLVDAPFFLYRAFHALPQSIEGAAGMPVNALLGSVNAVLSAADDHGARAVVTCFGPDAAPYRMALFDGYHAGRPPMPRELAWQWEQAPRLYEALGWHVAGRDDLEADDLLASYAAAEAKGGGRALIFTGDRDLFQCVDDRVRVLLAARGGPQLIDEAEVERRYGVPPALVPDFIALRGDPSDGIPGARGIGERTATEILRRHGSLEAALQAASKATVLHSAREQLLAFKEVATLRLLAVAPPQDREHDRKAGALVAADLGLNRLAKRLGA